MYQVVVEYSGKQGLDEQLRGLRTRIESGANPGATVLFHILNASLDKNLDRVAVDAIRRHFPQAPYVGCTVNAAIVEGEVEQGDGVLCIVCDVFEDPGTSIEIMQLSVDYDSQDETADALLKRLAERPDAKAVEVMSVVATANMPRFCQRVNAAAPDIVMFGGGAVNYALDFEDVVVYSSEGMHSEHGIAFVLYAGENLFLQTQIVQGWKPLGMPFHITRAERVTVQELNGSPALDVYQHYLHIPSDGSFLQNGLCFPISIDYEGTQVLRTPIASNPDGSIVTPTDVSDIHGECRIAYGDPIAILKNVHECVGKIREFRPQAILAFTCVARLLYWGLDYVACETRPFQALAPIAGFYSGGELIRQECGFMYHNSALVLVGIREGEAGLEPDVSAPTVEEAAPMAFNLQLSIIGRMASFIGAASQELEAANAELRAAYDNMERIARTDGLTGLYNRREVERVMSQAVDAYVAACAAGVAPGEEGPAVPPSLIMFDIDDFKKVNDTYGHEAGDNVLCRLAEMLVAEMRSKGCRATAGRWGGEEFMVVVPACDLDRAYGMAETLRTRFSDLDLGEVGHCTISVGVAQLRDGETIDRLCSRVDDALYQAKGAGKNCTVVDR